MVQHYSNIGWMHRVCWDRSIDDKLWLRSNSRNTWVALTEESDDVMCFDARVTQIKAMNKLSTRADVLNLID